MNMVAYTSPDCLPYFESTDSPCLNTGTLCDPSTIWCDFAELVEARLDEFDDTVARTFESVPMAWVDTTTPFTYVIGDPTLAVPFDTVRVDTDNMVNLDESSSSINVTRDGLYQVVGYGTAIFDRLGASVGSVALSIQFAPFLLTMGAITPNEFRASNTTANDLEVVSPKIQGVYAFQAGQAAIMAMTGSGVVGDKFTFSEAMMGLIWVGDLP
jgi:hypothetical protein